MFPSYGLRVKPAQSSNSITYVGTFHGTGEYGTDHGLNELMLLHLIQNLGIIFGRNGSHH